MVLSIGDLKAIHHVFAYSKPVHDDGCCGGPFLAILTAGVPASSDERVVNLVPHAAQQQQRAQPYKAFDGVKNNHDRFATKVDPPQEVEQTKMITK